MRNNSGQVVIFLLGTVFVLVLLTIWLLDTGNFLARKLRLRDAGDAVALSAASWQASTLNLIGELNLLHVLALSESAENPATQAITNLQQRLRFTGPMLSFASAQITAKKNDVQRDESLERLLDFYIAVLLDQNNDLTAFPENYPGARADYATMLMQIKSYGIYAIPCYKDFLKIPNLDSHILFDKALYSAILNKNWCWFHLNGKTSILSGFTNYSYWDALPPYISKSAMEEPEIFSLHLRTVTKKVSVDFNIDKVIDPMLEKIGHRKTQRPEARWIDENGQEHSAYEIPQTWLFFNEEEWGEIPADFIENAMRSPLKDEFNYRGADSAIQTVETVQRPSSEKIDKALWLAAAKPFGALNLAGLNERPTSYGLVLPCFDAIRLIPFDMSSGINIDMDIDFLIHIATHLEAYTETGYHEKSCRFCEALFILENPFFREEGIEWLRFNSDKCRRTGGGAGNDDSGKISIGH